MDIENRTIEQLEKEIQVLKEELSPLLGQVKVLQSELEKLEFERDLKIFNSKYRIRIESPDVQRLFSRSRKNVAKWHTHFINQLSKAGDL